MHLSSGGFKELDGGGPTGFQRQDLLLKARAASAPGDVRGSVELKLGYGREQSHETYLGLSYADWERTPYRRYAASQDDLMRWDRTQAELFGDLTVGRTRVDTRGVDARLLAGVEQAERVRGRARTCATSSSTAGRTVGRAPRHPPRRSGQRDRDQDLLIGTNNRRYRSRGPVRAPRHDRAGEGRGPS